MTPQELNRDRDDDDADLAGYKPTQYGQGREEYKRARRCRREHREAWRVTVYRGNRSAFNGYRWTPSDWSQVTCTADGCGRVWRTKAAYADELMAAQRSS